MSIKKLPKVLDVLSREGPVSPNRIAMKTGCDRRTIENILDVGTETGIINCKKMKIGKRTYSSCSIDAKFAKLYGKKGGKK